MNEANKLPAVAHPLSFCSMQSAIHIQMAKQGKFRLKEQCRLTNVGQSFSCFATIKESIAITPKVTKTAS